MTVFKDVQRRYMEYHPSNPQLALKSPLAPLIMPLPLSPGLHGSMLAGWGCHVHLEVGIANTVLDCFLGGRTPTNRLLYSPDHGSTPLSWVWPVSSRQTKLIESLSKTFRPFASATRKKVKAMKSTKRGSHGASEHLTFLALSRALHHFATSVICWSKFTNLLRVVTLASFLV